MVIWFIMAVMQNLCQCGKGSHKNLAISGFAIPDQFLVVSCCSVICNCGILLDGIFRTKFRGQKQGTGLDMKQTIDTQHSGFSLPERHSRSVGEL